jgi:hypothetical protein
MLCSYTAGPLTGGSFKLLSCILGVLIEDHKDKFDTSSRTLLHIKIYILKQMCFLQKFVLLIHVLQVIPAHLFVCKFHLENNRRDYGEV